MNDFNNGDTVLAGSTHARFVRYISPSQAIIAVGADTRVVDPVSLRKAS